MIILTKNQRKALDWLPDDGSWREKPGILSSALDSLYRRQYVHKTERPICIYEFGKKYGTSGGEGRRWRLTSYGIDIKRDLISKSGPAEDAG